MEGSLNAKENFNGAKITINEVAVKMRPFSLAHINKIVLFRYSERRKSYLAIKLLFEIEKKMECTLKRHLHLTISFQDSNFNRHLVQHN